MEGRNALLKPSNGYPFEKQLWQTVIGHKLVVPAFGSYPGTMFEPVPSGISKLAVNNYLIQQAGASKCRR
jgi:hypothetical protein